MKYGAVTPNEVVFYSSIRHLGFIYFVKQFLWRVYILNLTKENTKGRSIKVCEVLEWCFSCLELNKVPNRWKTFFFTWDNCKAAKWLHSNFPKLAKICFWVKAKHQWLLPRRDIVLWKERDSYNWSQCWAWKFHLNLIFSIMLLQCSHELHHCWSSSPGAADLPLWCNELPQQKMRWIPTSRKM